MVWKRSTLYIVSCHLNEWDLFREWLVSTGGLRRLLTGVGVVSRKKGMKSSTPGQILLDVFASTAADGNVLREGPASGNFAEVPSYIMLV